MKSSLRWVFLLSALCLFAQSASAVFVFEASLNGSQQVPPNTSTATGTATLTLNDAQDELEIMINLLGIDIDGNQTPGDAGDDLTSLHIHAAPAGSNGGVVFGLVSPNSDLDSDLMIDAVAGTLFSVWDGAEGFFPTTLAAQLTNLFADGLYINVHTNEFPGGEIRGQITQVPEPTTLALMTLGLAGLGFSRRKAN